MKTHFSPEQLSDSAISQADKILKTCVHCGLCTATCPSYLIRGDERDSPRGRINLIREMFEQGGKPGTTLVTHVDSCLSCLSCMTTCPSHVDYKHLIDLTRIHIEKKARRTIKQKLLRMVVLSVLPKPGRFKMAMIAGRLTYPLRHLFKKIKLPEVTAMLEITRGDFPGSGKYTSPGELAGDMEGRTSTKRVLLLQGCAQQVIRPGIHDAAVKVLRRSGADVIIQTKANCCGAAEYHLGKENRAIQAAKRIVDALTRAEADKPVDAIIITASGCGTHLKDYAHLLRNETGYAKRARALVEKTRDLSEFLEEDVVMRSSVQWSSLNVAYHAGCSLQHGQEVTKAPKILLQKAGFNVLDIPEKHICCGSAGTYNIMQPDIADQLLARKVKHIEGTKPDIIATENLGCIAQIARGTDIPVVHVIELIAWAQFGICPEDLKQFKDKITSVASFIEESNAQKKTGTDG